MLAVLGLVESGKLELISSEALEFEINRMPDTERQVQAKRVLTLASRTLELVDEIQDHAQALNGMGIKPFDALHLAFASWARVDFFCSCDDKLLKKARKLDSLNTAIVTPLQLLMEVAG